MVTCVSNICDSGLLVLKNPQTAVSLEKLWHFSPYHRNVLDPFVVDERVREVFVDEHAAFSVILVVRK